jgi:hypothetical protein
LIHIKPLSRTNANTPGTICSRNEAGGRGRLVALMERPQKITLAHMRASGVRGLLIYCSDYHYLICLGLRRHKYRNCGIFFSATP